jgi:hypothetical protein
VPEGVPEHSLLESGCFLAVQLFRRVDIALRRRGGLSLADALALCELLAATDPKRYERAALRWLQRFIDERLPPLAEVHSQRPRLSSSGTVGEQPALKH